MDYKMIVVDLDDSLLRNDLKISDINKKSLQRAAERGVLVTIATGRMYRSTLPFIDELRLNVPVITYQGALIKNSASNDTILQRLLPMKYAIRIAEFCKKEGLHLQVFIDDEYYYNAENKYSEMYRTQTGIRGHSVGDVCLFMDREPLKMIIIDEPGRIKILKEEFENVYDSFIQVTISKPSYLEFTHIEASKGKAVEHLCTMYGITNDEVIAIGDSYNDISMLEFAGLGVAMGNSPEIVKAKAGFITRSNDEDGVAYVIDEFIFGGAR